MKTESRIGMEIVEHLEYLKLIYRILYLNRNFEREPFNLLTILINLFVLSIPVAFTSIVSASIPARATLTLLI